MRTSDQPAAIIFGGNNNALSLVRSLGSRSIHVFTLNKERADVHASRFAERIVLPDGKDFEFAAEEFLLSSASDHLDGSVLLAASDEALDVINRNREYLAKKFRLDLSNPDAQKAMLDKVATYEIAKRAEVPTPQFWQLTERQTLQDVLPELVYPLIVKPKFSHLFEQRFNAKYILAKNQDDLEQAVEAVSSEGLDMMLVEYIPGSDRQLCSYYTFIDEQGDALFDFTKRIIRRNPPNMGLACYHVTDEVEGVGELSRKLFREAGLLGLTNAEFKLDPRDNVLKLIECNARFTAANGLVMRAGFDLGSFVYNRIVGLPLPPLKDFRKGVRLWDPIRDFQAFRALNRAGELGLGKWLVDICHLHTFPAFAWTDPKPSFVRLMRRFGKVF